MEEIMIQILNLVQKTNSFQPIILNTVKSQQQTPTQHPDQPINEQNLKNVEGCVEGGIDSGVAVSRDTVDEMEIDGWGVCEIICGIVVW